MKELVTPKQVAQAIGASEASLKRWCDKGILPAVRTAGGHRRLPINAVMEFLRRQGYALLRPEVLGLPVKTGRGREACEATGEPMAAALKAGDEEQFRRLTFDAYLGGQSACDICDRAIAPAFHTLGVGWQHGQLDVYEERRGCEVCIRVLHQLRRALPSVPESAPRAIGATLEGDPYAIPTLMAEIALAEAGWRADSYGVGLPVATLRAAIRGVRPQLFWLSVSVIDSVPDFLAGFASLYETAAEARCALAVGGRALTPEVRRHMQYAAFGDNLRHLVSFARTLAGS